MSAFTRPLIAATVLTMAVGCEPNPCDDYVNYMCDCHDGDPGVDCQTLGNTYANADAQLQDQCAISLEDQQNQDAIDGLVCATGTTGATGTTTTQ